MKKKEFKVGETFQFGLKTLKVEAFNYDEPIACADCVLYETDCRLMACFVGECDKFKRSDKKNVLFVEVKEEE